MMFCGVPARTWWFSGLMCCLSRVDGGWHVGFMGAFKVVCYCMDSLPEWCHCRRNIMFIFTIVG